MAHQRVGTDLLFDDTTDKVLGNEQSYGSLYCDDGAVNITPSDTTNYFPITSGMSDGNCSPDISFSAASTLTVSKPGMYHCDWSMSLSVASVSQGVGGCIMVGSTGVDKSENRNWMALTATPYGVSGTAMISLAAGDTVRLAVKDYTAGSVAITINHANLSIVRVGA